LLYPNVLVRINFFDILIELSQKVCLCPKGRFSKYVLVYCIYICACICLCHVCTCVCKCVSVCVRVCVYLCWLTSWLSVWLAGRRTRTNTCTNVLTHHTNNINDWVINFEPQIWKKKKQQINFTILLLLAPC